MIHFARLNGKRTCRSLFLPSPRLISRSVFPSWDRSRKGTMKVETGTAPLLFPLSGLPGSPAPTVQCLHKDKESPLPSLPYSIEQGAADCHKWFCPLSRKKVKEQSRRPFRETPSPFLTISCSVHRGTLRDTCCILTDNTPKPAIAFLPIYGSIFRHKGNRTRPE